MARSWSRRSRPARRGGAALGTTGVYLRDLPLEQGASSLVTRHSQGARSRAAQLRHFLAPLHVEAGRVLGTTGEVALVVASGPDWRRLCDYPYGFSFTRTAPGAQSASVVAAADYPPRFTRRFDDVLLEAAKAGATPPADIGEFLDLMVGHEWGHAVANLSGLRTHVRWLDELVATYVLAQALRATGQTVRLDRMAAWARVQVFGGDGADRRQRQVGTGEARPAAVDLASFEYPRGRTGLARSLWFQGVFTQRALEVSEARGWEFLLALRTALPAAHRGEVARALIDTDASFRPWFAVFGRPSGVNVS
ncbi:MAG: hypothetical protein R6W77_08630 [Trueperaceae bacterium]